MNFIKIDVRDHKAPLYFNITKQMNRDYLLLRKKMFSWRLSFEDVLNYDFVSHLKTYREDLLLIYYVALALGECPLGLYTHNWDNTYSKA